MAGPHIERISSFRVFPWLSFNSSQNYLELKVYYTMFETRLDYQSALYLKVIRTLHFFLIPYRKTQDGGGGGSDRLIEE